MTLLKKLPLCRGCRRYDVALITDYFRQPLVIYQVISLRLYQAIGLEALSGYWSETLQVIDVKR